MGSYTNTQNPPRFSANLLAGLRFFDETLALGGRMTCSEPPSPPPGVVGGAPLR